MGMRQPAPYCAHKMGSGLHCYRRTRHESGLCAQHRPGLSGRGQVPLSQRPAHVLMCEVDESGGMAELAEAERLLAAAYGSGAWVTHSSHPSPTEANSGGIDA